jgi:hypothetical protein
MLVDAGKPPSPVPVTSAAVHCMPFQASRQTLIPSSQNRASLTYRFKSQRDTVPAHRAADHNTILARSRECPSRD